MERASSAAISSRQSRQSSRHSSSRKKPSPRPKKVRKTSSERPVMTSQDHLYPASTKPISGPELLNAQELIKNNNALFEH